MTIDGKPTVKINLLSTDVQCHYPRCIKNVLPGKTRCRKHQDMLQKQNAKAELRKNERAAQGLCVTCGKVQAPSSKVYCERHLAMAGQHSKQQREKRRGSGICQSCTLPAVEGYVHCETHREKYRNQSNQRRKQALTSGQCSVDGCTLPTIEGKTRCEKHLEIQKQRQQVKYQELIAARLCLICGKPSDGKVRCPSCAKENYSSSRRLRDKRQNEGCCVYCGKLFEQSTWSRRSRMSCDACRKRLGGYSSSLKNRFGRARRENLKNRKGWTITFDQYENLLRQLCDYCGLPQDPTDTGTGLDRLDNGRGYHNDNVVSCCPVCNMVRNNVFTPEEMKILGVAVCSIKLAREIHFRPNKVE